MARLLYLEASPRKERSASTGVAKAFVEEYRKTHPGDVIDTLDLWGTTLPEFDGEVIDAKYAILHGQPHASGKKAAVVYARGGAYPAGSGGEAFDLQKRYMEQFLGFIGFTGITPIVVEPTLGKPESVERTKAEAAARARSAVGAF